MLHVLWFSERVTGGGGGGGRGGGGGEISLIRGNTFAMAF